MISLVTKKTRSDEEWCWHMLCVKSLVPRFLLADSLGARGFFLVGGAGGTELSGEAAKASREAGENSTTRSDASRRWQARRPLVPRVQDPNHEPIFLVLLFIHTSTINSFAS